MDRQTRHDLGYWMSIIGFAVVVSVGLFGSFISLETWTVVSIALFGFAVFLIGAEMALRNGKHVHPFKHEG